MQLTFEEKGSRHTWAYRAFKRRIRQERPLCEHCNRAKSEVVAHIVQPLLGGGLLDPLNVLALCKQCDRFYTRTHPALRRRSLKRS